MSEERILEGDILGPAHKEVSTETVADYSDAEARIFAHMLSPLSMMGVFGMSIEYAPDQRRREDRERQRLLMQENVFLTGRRPSEPERQSLPKPKKHPNLVKKEARKRQKVARQRNRRNG